MVLFAIFICALYSAACVGAGIVALRIVGVPHLETRRLAATAIVTTAFLIGQGLLASIWVLLALARAFLIIPIIAVMLAFLAIGARLLRTSFSNIGRRLAREITSSLRNLTVPMRLFAPFLLVIVLLLGVFNLLLPVRFGVGDGMFYYFVLPKVVAASGHLFPIAGYEFSHSVLGLQGEMHYAALMALASEQAALLFAWVTALGTAAMLVSLCDVLGIGKPGKWIAAAALFSTTAFTLFIGDGKIEIFAAVLGVAAYFWALQADALRPTAVRLAGLFCGLAVVAKANYTLAVALPALALVILETSAEGDPAESIWAKLAAKAKDLILPFSVFALVPLLPHFLKNALLFGEPFAPIFYLDSQPAFRTAYPAAGPGPGILLNPVRLFLYSGYDNASPLLLALLPFAAFVPVKIWKKHARLLRMTGIVLVATALNVVIISPIYYANRLLLPLLIVLIPAVAFGAGIVFMRSARFRGLQVAMVICMGIAVLGFSPLGEEFGRLRRLWLQQASQCAFDGILWFPLDTCEALLSLNEVAAPGARVFHQGYTYWLRADLIQCLPNREEWRFIKGAPTETERWERMYEHGFRYFVASGDSSISDVPDWLTFSPVNSSGDVRVYSLDAHDLERQPLFACQQLQPPAWEIVRSDNP